MTTMLEKFYEEKPWLDVRGNDSFLLSKAGHPITLAGLENAAMALGDSLLVVGAYRDGWNQFAVANPKYGGIIGNRNVLFALLRGDEPTLANLTECAESSQCSLAINSAYTQAAHDEAEKTRLAAELGRPDLAGLPLEDLREMAATAADQQRMKNLPADTLRAEMAAVAAKRLQQVHNQEKPPVPETWEVTEPNKYFRFAEVIQLTRGNFMRLEKEDIRRILTMCGNKNVDAFLGVQPRPEVGHIQSVKFNL